MKNDKQTQYLDKIKKLIETEYIYIYNHEVTYVDACFEGHIIKNDCAGVITTRVNNFNTFIIEVNKDEKN